MSDRTKVPELLAELESLRRRVRELELRCGDVPVAAEREASGIRTSPAGWDQLPLIQNLPVGVYCTSADGQLLECNPALVEMLGYSSSEELERVNVLDLYVHKTDREEQLEKLGAIDVHFSEFEIRRKDGQTRWVRDYPRVIRDESGRVRFMNGILVDITERKRAEESLRRRDAILEAVSFATEQLLHASMWEEVVPAILERLGRSMEVSRCFLYENHLGSDRQLLTSKRFAWGASDVVLKFNPKMLNLSWQNSGLSRWRQILSSDGIVQGNIEDYPAAEQAAMKALDIEHKSLLLVPIFAGKEWWGFIGFDEIRCRREWTSVEKEALRATAGAMGTTVQRQRMLSELQALTLTDELTGLNNRRGFTVLSRQQLKIADRTQHGFWLFFVDFDELKRINDTFGHQNGDMALIETSSILRETFRESDIIARMSGDEFAIITLDDSSDVLDNIVDRFRKKMSVRNAKGDLAYRLSASIGAARYDPRRPNTLEELLDLADAQMFLAKRGKSRS